MATTRRAVLRGLAVAAVALLLSAPLVLATAATDVAFTIRDARITESSGLARDTKLDLYWTVNDSDEEGTAYGVDGDGNVKGIVGFRAQPQDVEAVAMSGRRLYLADIGDNRAKRDTVTVYVLNDPEPDNRTVSYRSYDFRYPDGAHDAETLLVRDGRLYLVTKELGGGIYRAPKDPSRSEVNKLARVGDAPAFVTDGVFLPGGDRIALRTYVSVEVLDADSYATVARAEAPYVKQGESISLALEGSSLLLGSEGRRSPVVQMAIPTSMADTPSAGSAPPPSSTPTPTPSVDAAQEPEPADEPAEPTARRVGTTLALALAGFVALVAGVVVAARR
jgi:hypothetical protein